MSDPTCSYPDWRPGQYHRDQHFNWPVMMAQFRKRWIQEQIRSGVRLGIPADKARGHLLATLEALVRDFSPPEHIGFPGTCALDLKRLLEELQNG